MPDTRGGSVGTMSASGAHCGAAVAQIYTVPAPAPSHPPHARAPHASPASGPALSEWVGLKWLMGLQGRRVDVARLQDDPDYARGCLDEACTCADPALRDYAQRLRQRLAA